MNKTEKIDKVGHTSSEQSTLGAENFGRTRMETYVSRACEEKIFRIQERMELELVKRQYIIEITAFYFFMCKNKIKYI